MKKVIVIGGGVAGMSAAHELIERGFEVEVYEKQPHYVGGKARSVDVPLTATSGKKPLPGEHGFRFFPGFYQHVTDTMKRIPFPGNEEGVFSNLVSTERVAMGREGMNEIITLVNFPKSKKDLQVMLYALKNSHTGITDDDVNSMVNKVWQLMTSCKERRLNEYERIGWWLFTNADFHSEAYREFFVGGLTRTLVAAKPRQVSTRTGGDILLQLIFQMTSPGKRTDRVLNGPTNEAWLDPWYNYLTKEKKVKFFHKNTATQLHCSKSVLDGWDIIGVDVEDENGKKKTVTGDYYILAVPVEVAGKLINNSENITIADPVLSTISDLAEDVSWMTGIQYFLNVDIPITKGHVMIIDSPWAVTVISQPQFWDNIKLSEYGDGTVKGIISVDISDWNSPGFTGKCARECTKEEIAQEVWCQITLGLLVDGKQIFNKDMLVDCFLDRDIRKTDGSDPTAKDNDIDVSKIKDCDPKLVDTLPDKYALNPPKHVEKEDFKTINEEPLLVNKINTWNMRPESYCQIPNLYFAADYVRTNTDLATMEGANEAARRAVNNIIDHSKLRLKKCEIWEMHEPLLLWPFRRYDLIRFRKGLPWNEDFPFILMLWFKLIALFKKKK